MFSSKGGASPAVDTVLSVASVRPGDALDGEVRIFGGDQDADVEYVGVGLVAALGEDELIEFDQADLEEDFLLEAGSEYVVPFRLELPYDLPLTHVFGQRLEGMEIGVRTELGLFGERDQGDLDEITVRALPAQEAIFDALEAAGFVFDGADLETGELDIEGLHQTLPVFQELEFHPPAHFARKIDELDLTFVASQHQLEVVMFIGKRGGLLRAGGEEIQVFSVDYRDVGEIDWPAQLDEWIAEAAKSRF